MNPKTLIPFFDESKFSDSYSFSLKSDTETFISKPPVFFLSVKTILETADSIKENFTLDRRRKKINIKIRNQPFFK